MGWEKEEERRCGRGQASGALGMGGSAQEQAPRAGPKATGRLGKHQPTQPVAEDVGGGDTKAEAREHGFG